MEDIKIIDFLCGKCLFKGCWHNDSGICLNTDEDFLLNTLDYIRDICEKNVDDIFDKSFKCEPKLYDNTCKYCGGVFKKHIDFVPYSDIHTPMKTCYCPNCD
ncbi:MAG: hypothetical protein QM266_02550 [Bacillota bacterium]|nr:hypothetical protein [Bacillota bacterium]